MQPKTSLKAIGVDNVTTVLVFLLNKSYSSAAVPISRAALVVPIPGVGCNLETATKKDRAFFVQSLDCVHGGAAECDESSDQSASLRTCSDTMTARRRHCNPASTAPRELRLSQPRVARLRRTTRGYRSSSGLRSTAYLAYSMALLARPVASNAWARCRDSASICAEIRWRSLASQTSKRGQDLQGGCRISRCSDVVLPMPTCGYSFSARWARERERSDSPQQPRRARTFCARGPLSGFRRFGPTGVPVVGPSARRHPRPSVRACRARERNALPGTT